MYINITLPVVITKISTLKIFFSSNFTCYTRQCKIYTLKCV